MSALGVLGLAYLAMATVSASMGRHQHGVLGRELGPAGTRLLRLGGWLLLAVALAPAVMAWGASVGVAGWLAGHADPGGHGSGIAAQLRAAPAAAFHAGGGSAAPCRQLPALKDGMKAAYRRCDMLLQCPC